MVYFPIKLKSSPFFGNLDSILALKICSPSVLGEKTTFNGILLFPVNTKSVGDMQQDLLSPLSKVTLTIIVVRDGLRTGNILSLLVPIHVDLRTSYF